MRFGCITPSPVERKLLNSAAKEFGALRKDQKARAYHLMRSWGVDENWYGIHGDRVMRCAIKNVKRNYP